ncbi:hypothetical protein KLP28_13490 [Nocardioidaceae bacterium]|nr:hypothetical protein KLP28_13490 [Nocardioidaceae bacterium]
MSDAIQASHGWQNGLPLNRKERYYTGSVLPGLVAGDEMQHLPRFLSLCGLDVEIGDADGVPAVHFLTEYGFAESVATESARSFWGTDTANDTPDVVIVGPDWLVAIEAKMFHTPTEDALNEQMAKQATIISLWRDKLGLDAARVKHLLLLPQPFSESRPGLTHQVLTWETVRDEFASVGSDYWRAVLEAALDAYADLKSPDSTYGQNSLAKLAGHRISEDGVVTIGDEVRQIVAVGRHGGLGGAAFADDLATGAWQSRRYEISDQPPKNENWFTIHEFKHAVSSAGSKAESE